jgi:hypothetical protein
VGSRRAASLRLPRCMTCTTSADLTIVQTASKGYRRRNAAFALAATWPPRAFERGGMGGGGEQKERDGETGIMDRGKKRNASLDVLIPSNNV